jgi:hypothetical protein
MSERGVKCGKCKGYHPNVREVRACYLAAAGQTPSAPAQVAQEALAVPAPTEPGFYTTGAATYRLAPTMEWSKLLSNGRFATGCSAPVAPRRMTVDEVAAQGRIHVRCIVCGITLKNPKSRALGIGPVCRGYV